MPLVLVIPETEFFNEDTNEFTLLKETTIKLEHSLVSIAKWESRNKEPFIGATKTDTQIEEYIKDMCITQNVPNRVFDALGTYPELIQKIDDYINDDMSATTFGGSRNATSNTRKKSKIITNEVIYYWMFQHNLHIDCSKWHINRLLTLIRVSNEFSNDEKMTPEEVLLQNKQENARRRKELGSEG